MGYRRKSYYNNSYSMNGGYDSTGRWRSEAWHMDGGSNDEGWHHRYCSYCATETEHGRQSTGNFCVPCDNRVTAARARKNRKNPAGDDRKWIFKLYEEKAGELPAFIKSLKEQNEKRCLSPKQVAVGRKILAEYIDEGTLTSYWIAAHRK